MLLSLAAFKAGRWCYMPFQLNWNGLFKKNICLILQEKPSLDVEKKDNVVCVHAFDRCFIQSDLCFVSSCMHWQLTPWPWCCCSSYNLNKKQIYNNRALCTVLLARNCNSCLTCILKCIALGFMFNRNACKINGKCPDRKLSVHFNI